MSHVSAQDGPLARRERLRRFFPLDNGPQEIRALDGLRALAALSVVVYHAFSVVGAATVVGGVNLYAAWDYGRTGVQLFFVLSGFLLFLPYARAMLLGRTLPSARRFYWRRILRIVPAYWVCLALLVAIDLPAYLNATGLANVGAHLAFLHNLFPAFDSSIEGPFWTMAVEAQFYLLLPAIAWLIARFVARSSSLGRLLLGVVALIAAAVVVRELSALVSARLPLLQGGPLQAATAGLLVVHGAEGRYLDTFGVGMLCAVFYVARDEGRLALSPRATRLASWLLFVLAVAAAGGLGLRVAARRTALVNACYACLYPRDVEGILGPLLLGVAYGLLLLAVLLSVGALRRLFALAPLRFVGLISYSLYLWHLPLLLGLQVYTVAWAPGPRILADLGVAALSIGVAYVSYQLVERPFLKRRHAQHAAEAPTPTPAPAAVPALSSPR